MNLQYRIDLLVKLGEYISANNAEWQQTKEQASRENSWFIPSFVELACTNIVSKFLNRTSLEEWASSYQIPADRAERKKVGIVMAGNIPLVGFHDMLCVFVAGH